MSPRMVKWLVRLAALLRTRSAIVLLVLFVGLLVATALFLRGKPEPAYNHLPASDWLQLVSTNNLRLPDVIEAFQNMGPAGGEFLAEELSHKPTQVEAWLLDHHQQIPGPFKKFLLRPQRQSKGETIITILARLGTNAAPAVPPLITWLENQNTRTYTPYVSPAVTTVPQKIISVTPMGKQTNIVQLYVMGGNGSPFSVSQTPPVHLPNLVTQKQVVVSAPGLVTTNVNVVIKTASFPIPDAAFQILTNFGSDDPRVIPLLLNPVGTSRTPGPTAFGPNLRRAALRSVPLLAKTAEHRDPNRRWLALSLLRLTLPQSAVARELMIRSLTDPNTQVFDFAIGSLQTTTNELDRIVPLAVLGLQRFRNRTTDLFGEWQPPVYQALGEFSRHSPQVIPQLEALLPQADFYEQIGILQLLRKIGTTNTVDLALLERFTRHQDTSVRAAAWLALGQLKNDKVAEAAGHITLLEIGGDQQAWQSYVKLGELGPSARAAVPVLIRHLQQHDLRMIAKAAETLGKIGPAAQDALGPLHNLLAHPDNAVRAAAMEAIRQISAGPI